MGCTFANTFDTFNRTPAFLNALAAGPDPVDFWHILGDNFYDKDGSLTTAWFGQLETATKATPFATALGNHDYWVRADKNSDTHAVSRRCFFIDFFFNLNKKHIYERKRAVFVYTYPLFSLKGVAVFVFSGGQQVHGTPESATDDDDYSNGKLQFYAQDAAASVLQGQIAVSDNAVFLNLTVDPDGALLTVAQKRPDVSNSVWWHAMGDLGFVGYSGAYTFAEVQPYFAQACEWLGALNANATFVVGHWNDAGMGCDADMDVPDVFAAISAMPGCDGLAAKSSLRYVMGHTHCNSVTEANTGFMVAGQGMGGCGNFGVPVFDTATQPGRVQVHYFDLTTAEVAAAATSCVRNQGYGACLGDFATTWLDVPIPA